MSINEKLRRRRQTRRILGVVVLLLSVLVIGLAWQKLRGPGFGDDIAGVAVEVYDGDTFVLDFAGPELLGWSPWRNTQKIRIWGIEAPERGEHGFVESRDFLAALLEGRALTCRVVERQRAIGWYAARLVAQCFRDTPGAPSDVAAEMVAAGYAVDSPEYSGCYYAAEGADAPCGALPEGVR